MASATSSRTIAFAKPQYFNRREGSNDEWFCNLCTPGGGGGSMEYMTAEGALQHELYSSEHAQNIGEAELWWGGGPADPAAWAAPLDEGPPQTFEEMREREIRLHVDHVKDLVPFWMRGVEAAERGEVLRLEAFLETLEEESWMGSTETWGFAYPAAKWGEDRGWGEGGEKWEWGRGGEEGWSGRGWGAADSLSSLNNLKVRTESRSEKNRRFKELESKWKGKGKGKQRLRRGAGDAYMFVEEVARQQAADADRKQRMHSFFEMPTQEKLKKIDEVIRCLRSTHG